LHGREREHAALYASAQEEDARNEPVELLSFGPGHKQVRIDAPAIEAWGNPGGDGGQLWVGSADVFDT
jgi:hypothetical protein